MADRAPQSGKQPQSACRTQRLHRVMAHAGIGSRRTCEDLIESGDVEVNGKIVTEHPILVDPERDDIRVRGQALPRPERKIYVMLYKPRRVVSTMEDPQGRMTVAEIVDHPGARRLYPVGRLDFDTMGLLLMTNDGELADRLTHPRYGVHKTYRATVKGRLDEEDVEHLRKGIVLATRKEGRTVGAERTTGAQIRIVGKEQSRTVLEITLQEGRNRQVRRMLAAVGSPVKKLIRTKMGPLTLKGLQMGAWRELTRQEIATLRKAANQGARQARAQRAATG